MKYPEVKGKGIGWPWVIDNKQRVSTDLFENPLPRITVVTPSFNQGRFLEETIRSVLLQGYPNLEYIIMDGGSTDESIEILRRYEPFLNYLHIGPDGGQSAAIADGFDRATGEILAWLNSDDLYMPGALARVGRFFTLNPESVFLHSDVQLIAENSQPCGMLHASPTNLFLTKNTGAHGWWQPGTFWHRETYMACGVLDRQLQFCMDRDLFIRICSAGKSQTIRGKPLAAFRVQQEQKSQRIVEVFLQEHELLLERYGNPKLRQFRPLLGRLWSLWKYASSPLGVHERL